MARHEVRSRRRDRLRDDGVFWCNDHVVDVEAMRKVWRAPVKDGWQVRFVPDGKETEQAVFLRSVGGATETITIQKWEGLADCAHFLTRCISAGGIAISEISVPKLIGDLKRRPYVKILAETLTKAQGQRIVDSGVLKKGDMVGYVNIDPNGDWGKMNQYTHSAMYAGKLGSGDAGRITCHTKSRFPGLSAFSDLWHLDDPSHIFSFFHFSQDDDAPLNVVSKVSGWWKKADNGIAYYYLAVGGRCYFYDAPSGPTSRAAERVAPVWVLVSPRECDHIHLEAGR